MQTFNQTFATSTTWKLEVPGRYFTTIGCTNAVNVRFYKNGKKLDLGDISSIQAGLEVMGIDFNRVDIDVTGPDTVTIGIGNGQARYNRSAGSVQVTSTKPPTTGTVTHTSPALAATTNTALLSANANRTYLAIQNNDASANLRVAVNTAASATVGLKLPPGGVWEPITIPTQAINGYADAAISAGNLSIIEGA